MIHLSVYHRIIIKSFSPHLEASPADDGAHLSRVVFIAVRQADRPDVVVALRRHRVLQGDQGHVVVLKCQEVKERRIGKKKKCT